MAAISWRLPGHTAVSCSRPSVCTNRAANSAPESGDSGLDRPAWSPRRMFRAAITSMLGAGPVLVRQVGKQGSGVPGPGGFARFALANRFRCVTPFSPFRSGGLDGSP